MWQCEKCSANLLDSTPECPVCQIPEESAEIHAIRHRHEPEIDDSSKYCFWSVIGILFPPLGLIMLLTFLLTPSDKSKPNDDQKAPPPP